MFRCPTIDERVFAASLHHPTRRDGLRVPFPCDWHAQLPSAAGTLSLSLVVLPFPVSFFFFSDRFPSFPASRVGHRLFPFILAPRIPWLRCLVRVRISPSCDVLSVFAPQLLHVWVSVVSRGGAPPFLPLVFFFFLLFFTMGMGWNPIGTPMEWDRSNPPARLSLSLSLSLSLHPLPCRSVSLSLSPPPLTPDQVPSTMETTRPRGKGDDQAKGGVWKETRCIASTPAQAWDGTTGRGRCCGSRG